MSHFTVYTTALGEVTVQLVQDAVAELAKQIGATLITSMTSTYWEREKVLTGLKSAEVPNGIGVRVQNGQLQICGDPYQQHAGYAKLQSMIPKYVEMYKVKLSAKNKCVGGLRAKSARIQIKERALELVVGY
jgi:hypothetical protein